MASHGVGSGHWNATAAKLEMKHAITRAIRAVVAVLTRPYGLMDLTKRHIETLVQAKTVIPSSDDAYCNW